MGQGGYEVRENEVYTAALCCEEKNELKSDEDNDSDT